MDWTDRREHRKKVRKMAAKMLWADFKDMFFSWRVLVLLMLYLCFVVLALIKDMDDYNVGACFYFITWVVMWLYALVEKVFNYLPVSDKDIILYMHHRTNLLTAWIVVLIAGTALLMDLFGVELFVERGVVCMLMLLFTVEWMHQTALFENSPGKGKWLTEELTTGQKVRYGCYFVYSIGFVMVSMLYGMFMESNENTKTWVIAFACAYALMYVFRADISSWFVFDEYKKRGRRTIYASQKQLEEERNQ